MNFGVDWVEALSAQGADAIHWTQVGHPRAPDEEIVEGARESRCAVVIGRLTAVRRTWRWSRTLQSGTRKRRAACRREPASRSTDSSFAATRPECACRRLYRAEARRATCS